MERMDLLQQVDERDTKDCMLDALRSLMRSKPYKDITIKDICTKSGFSRKTFYDNFSKRMICWSIWRRIWFWGFA